VSDKADYAPGATVTLTGSGWEAGEAVHLFVNDTIGQTWSYNADVVADSSGQFSKSFQLPNTFISDYDVTATGAGGEKATLTFTDSTLATATIATRTTSGSPPTCTATSQSSFASGSTVCVAVTTTVNGNGTADWRLQWYAPGVNPSSGTPARDQPFTTGATTVTDTFAVTATGTWTVVACKTSNAGSCSSGNQTGTTTFVVTGDTTAPSSAIQCNGAGCSSSFYGANVSVTLSATDSGGSGLKEIRYTIDGTTTPDATHGTVYSGAFTVSATTTVKFAAIDNAGNVESAHSQLIQLDKTAPTVTASIVGTLGNNGWYVSDVNVSFTVGDADSGIATQSADCAGRVIASDQSSTTYTCTATNGAGLSAFATATVKRDATAPSVTVSLARVADHNGWYTAPVGYGVTARSDATSGIDSCQADATYSGPDDGSASVSRTCTDVAGNVGSDSQSLKYDATAPSGLGTALSRIADHNGWYNHAVAWSTTGTDATSGIDSCSSGTYSGPDGTGLTISGSCTDRAGNSSSAASTAFRYDNTAPLLGITDANVASENLCGSVLPNRPTFVPSDATSGIDAATTGDAWSPSTSASGVGTYTYSAHVTDVAGNTALYGPKTYTVLYGDAVVAAIPFLQPINTDGSSRFKIGSTIPVKFQAKCNGVVISNVVARMYVKQGDSQPDPGVDEAVSTSAATTGNLFRWTGSPDNQYIFNLSTKLGYTNPDNTTVASFAQGTWTLKIGLDDGTFRSINVQLVR
jgi:hypothetical protein